MNNKEKEIIKNMQTYIILASVIFSIFGIIIGHFAFPRVDWYEIPKNQETMFVNYNGEAVPYNWNNTDETWHLQDGVIYDAESDKYYCTKGCWRHGSWDSDDGYPNIPYIDREPDDDLSLSEQIELLQKKIDEQQRLIFNITKTTKTIDDIKLGKYYDYEIMFTEIEPCGSVVLYEVDKPFMGYEVLLYNVSYILFSDFCQYPQSTIFEGGIKAVFYKMDEISIEPIPLFDPLNVRFVTIYKDNFGTITVFKHASHINCGGN